MQLDQAKATGRTAGLQASPSPTSWERRFDSCPGRAEPQPQRQKDGLIRRFPTTPVGPDSRRPRLSSATGIGALTHRRSPSSLPSTWCGGCTAPGQSISSTRRLYDCISRIDHQENNNRP